MEKRSGAGLPADIDRAEQIRDQDIPDSNTEKAAKAPRTLAELVKIAEAEADFQSAVRGPIVVPEWNGMKIYYRRMDADRQVEVVKAYVKHGRENFAIFAERALLENGDRMFPQNWDTYINDLKRWNQDVINRVVDQMATGSQTQLTDADLGK